MTRPIRLQRSRAKGSRLVSPNGLPVRCVTRGTRWGNPYIVDVRLSLDDESREAMRRIAVENFRKNLLGQLELPAFVLPFTIDDVRRELAGCNLACWCKLGDVCHADVLLEVASR